MTCFAGTDFLLKKGKPTENPQTLGGLRTTGFVLNNDLVDATHKLSEGKRTILPQSGVQKCTISASGLFTNTDTEGWVRNQAFNRTLDIYSLYFANGDILMGEFYITHYARNGDYNNEETYTLTLESSGALSWIYPQTET
jgi:TP901-1 family phage major tail protein